MLFQSSRRLNRWRSNNSFVHGLMSAGQRWSLHPAEHPSVPRARRRPLGRHRRRSNFWAFQFPKTGHARSRNRFQQRSARLVLRRRWRAAAKASMPQLPQWESETSRRPKTHRPTPRKKRPSFATESVHKRTLHVTAEGLRSARRRRHPGV
jgi:hypothetical protein